VYFATKMYIEAQGKYEEALEMYKQVFKNGHAEIDRWEKSLRKIKEMMKTELLD